ncbi:putative transcriptional regulator, TetR family [Nocardia nova SH22a]|uniref:Putative transcriptional regulator, TetR family n=2 Tax=Nocardia nova TaxID=37330 RepID=W5T7N5_9NOCA|nr:putative transcriptional regulator, TetR family [Nocardia nova SH22a]
MTRDALVAAARPLFARTGFSEVSVEAIVRAASVSRGALYHHFTDKNELFAAVLEEIESEVADRIRAAAADGADADPIDVMRSGAAAFLDACAEPEIHRIMLVDAPAVLGWVRWTEISAQNNMGLIQDLLAQSIETGRIPVQPVDPLAHTLLGALREAALYLARSEDTARARREVGDVIDRLIRNLAADPSQ